MEPSELVLKGRRSGRGRREYTRARRKKAACSVKLGAELLEDQTRGPAGIYSVVRDPGGATVALWQKA